MKTIKKRLVLKPIVKERLLIAAVLVFGSIAGYYAVLYYLYRVAVTS